MGDAEVMRVAEFLGRLLKGEEHLRMRDGRVREGDILSGCAIFPDRRGSDGQVAGFDFLLKRTGGPDPDEGIGADLDQLLQRDRRRRAADPGRGNRDLDPFESSGEGSELSFKSNFAGVVKVAGYLLRSSRVAREENIPPDITRRQIDVILFFSHEYLPPIIFSGRELYIFSI